MAGTGQRGLADVLDRAVLGAGEVAGQRQDRRSQHDADHDRRRRRRRAGLASPTSPATLAELAEAHPAGRRRTGSTHATAAIAGRDVERAVDGDQAVLAGAGAAEVDAGDCGQGADRGDQQREDQALVAEGLRAEDQRGDQRHGVRLEEVGRHAGAVTDVVADVVGDGRGVARVVLGDVVLDLADQVGADVGGLGEDAAADSHEHGEQRGTEAEALEHVGCVVLEGRTTTLAPSRPRPTVSMPTMAPVRKPMRHGRVAARSSLAAAATRRLARTASDMPR